MLFNHKVNQRIKIIYAYSIKRKFNEFNYVHTLNKKQQIDDRGFFRISRSVGRNNNR